MLDKLKNSVAEKIDENKERIYGIADEIFASPELGYREIKTSGLVKREFEKLKLEYADSLAVTGLKAYLRGAQDGPTVGIMGEMDAVTCHDHPSSALENGAAHTCGHQAQVAVMLGVAMGLKYSGVMEHLSGNLSFMAVPAEEFIDLDYRKKLLEGEKVKYFGGKQELISQGALDDIDIAVMMHLLKMDGNFKAYLGANTTGFIAKEIRYSGKISHAAVPHEGVNALNAAIIAINAINANREVFRDEDNIRFQTIFSKGGDAVNVVPGDVTLEAQLRSNNSPALDSAGEIINRCLHAGALSVSADVEIRDIPGYLPMNADENLMNIFNENCSRLIEKESIGGIANFPASFDFGDITHLIPGLHPFFGGIEGNLHTKDFKVCDKELAYIIPAKTLAFTVIDLLYGKAEKAGDVINKFTPKYTKEEYLSLLESRKRVIRKSYLEK